MSDLETLCEGKGSVPQAKSSELPKQVQVQVLLVFGLESQRWTVAEASFNTWWGKAQDMTVARHRAWHQDGV